MIDEAIGKILGMVMAYGASAMGMFVAYVNYRKRTVKADRIMTPAAWTVVLLSVLATGAGALVVLQLAQAPAAEAALAEEVLAEVEAPAPVPAQPEVARDRGRWPLVGMIIPAAIFLFATVITAGLHRHFTAHEH